MPELPEVETSRQGITPYLKAQVIDKIIVRQPQLRWLVDPQLKQAENQTIIDVQRRAKYLLLKLTNDWIVIHLGMSGSLRILLTDKAPEKHDHIDIVLKNGVILRYTDPRRFGAWLWTKSPDLLSQLSHLGPEPLSEDFTAHYFVDCIKNRKKPIKSIIMDNHIVVGVGNIYASESLFMAKINPNRLANTITPLEAKNLVQAIKAILEKAITQGGTTLKDFLQSDGKPGYFSQQLQVYGRDGEPCFICKKIVCSQKIAQRNTFYCPDCQI